MPELAKLRVGTSSSVSHVAGRVATLLAPPSGADRKEQRGGASAGGGGGGHRTPSLQRIGDTLLLPTLGTYQMEVRLTIHGGVGKAAFGVATCPSFFSEGI